jgi:phosphate transport system protein
MDPHTSKRFDTEMEKLRSDVLAMGGLVEEQLARAVVALNDCENAELLALVKSREAEINAMQVDIDRQCMEIIVTRQPAGIDLRTLLTIGKVVTDLERIGDEAKKVARKAASLQGNERVTKMQFFEAVHAGELAQESLKRILNAFARLDVNEAITVYDADEAIDISFDVITRQIIGFMMEDPRCITAMLDVLLVAKAIERIGDHIKNISESVVQIVMGKDVRHTPMDEVKQELAESKKSQTSLA